jgi:hypothetical protein
MPILLFWITPCLAEQMVSEPATGKEFPSRVIFAEDNKEYALDITGVSVRKKIVIKVYAMAHYMQSPPMGDVRDIIKAVLTDGKPKQITMDFVRSVGSGSIQEAFRDGFAKNATKAEFQEIESLVHQFCGYFDRDVKENDRFVLRWLPGGKVIARAQGKKELALVSPVFARALWSIWFGEDSIVDRSQLVGMVRR